MYTNQRNSLSYLSPFFGGYHDTETPVLDWSTWDRLFLPRRVHCGMAGISAKLTNLAIAAPGQTPHTKSVGRVIFANMKKRLVIANWKMYIDSPEEAKGFVSILKRRAASFAGVDAWIAPPFTLLPVLKGIKLGGQAVSANIGAHTGEVSALMLKGAGASFVIVGHSERRALGDTDEHVHAQLAAAAGAGLAPVLCVGEDERTPEGSHFTKIAEQSVVVHKLLNGLLRATKDKKYES